MSKVLGVISAVAAWLVSGTGRRLLAFLAALAIPLLNKKFGWELSEEAVVGQMVLALGYITGSNLKEGAVAKAQAMAAANPGAAVSG